MKNKKRKNTKKIDTIVNSIQPLHLPITNAISNTQNNQRPQVGYFETNLSKYYRSEQYVVADEIG